MTIFVPTIPAHSDIAHQRVKIRPLELVHGITTDDRRGTLAGAIICSSEAFLFGAVGNLNIIRFAIINFVYNAETISRTLVT